MKIRGQTVYAPHERLARLSESDPTTGCRNWTGSLRNGYGRLIVGSRTDGTRHSTTAHRYSYEVHRGPIADGLEVCHRCDNPRCINPEHLFLGTRQDNIDDREAKGRNVVARGEANGASKLTEADVAEARRLRGLGHTYQSIATRFGVHKRTAMRVVKSEHWNHVPAAPQEGSQP